jgi:hypothetical protein
MLMVKRYELTRDHGPAYPVESNEGEWVEASDYADLERLLRELYEETIRFGLMLPGHLSNRVRSHTGRLPSKKNPEYIE